MLIHTLTRMGVFIGLVVMAHTLSACARSYTHAPGGPYYFQTFVDDYQVPYTPKGEITAAEAASNESTGHPYCIAWFNEQGRIAVFEKRMRGKIFFRVTYTYQDGKLVKVQGVDADGKQRVQTF